MEEIKVRFRENGDDKIFKFEFHVDAYRPTYIIM